MASSGVFELTRVTAIASGDVLSLVAIADTTQSAHGSLDSITIANFFAAIPVAVGIVNTLTVKSAGTSALAVGANGATNPVLRVDASTASVATGITITGAAAGGGVAIVARSSGTDESLTLNAKGAGTIGIGSVSTGAVTITPATTITGALTQTGRATFNGGATVASGQTLTLTGVTVSAINGQTISSTAAFTGTVTVAAGLTVTAGGLTISAGLLTAVAGFSAGASSTITDSGSGAVPLVVKNTNGSFGGNVVAALATRAASVGFVLYSGTANNVDVFYVLGNGNVQNTNNSYGALSDARLKDEIVDAASQLGDFRAFRFVNYRLTKHVTRRGTLHDLATPSGRMLGLVAQDVEQVSPGLVDTDANGFKSVKYSVLGVKTARATQELIGITDSLVSRVTALEQRMSS